MIAIVDIESRLAAEAAVFPEADATLRRLAQLYLWDREPAFRHGALAAPELPVLIWRLLKDGMAEDVTAARNIWGGQLLLETMQAAPPGRIDARSWTFWHLQFGVDIIPPLPDRQVHSMPSAG